jgi:hypothetical protein
LCCDRLYLSPPVSRARPPSAIAKSSIAAFFSPRKADNMLDWYGQRIGDTASLAMMGTRQAEAESK